MSDTSCYPTDTNALTQRLQSAEKSIVFIQREHASTLANLHEEIAKWQQKCSDLTFQLAIGGGTVVNSTDESKLRATIKQLENEIQQHKKRISDLNRVLEEKEQSIKDNENRLLVNERNHVLELRLENDKYRQLKAELEQRSTLIAQLTSQLHREKQLQQQSQTRARLGQMILPNKPTKFESASEIQQKQLPPTKQWHRSSSLSNRASPDQGLNNGVLVKRRPPTPPQQLRPLSSRNSDSNDEPQDHKRRQRQLLSSCADSTDSSKVASLRPSIKLTVLPPIANRKVPLKALPTATFQQEGEA